MGRKCSKLEATLGLEDQQKTTFPAYITVSLDQQRVLSQEIRYGEQYPIELDVSGGLRISFSVDSAASKADVRNMGSTYGSFVWGDLRVLCSEPPPDTRN